MDFKNYIRFKKTFSPFRYYGFLDAKTYLADSLFIKHKARVKFHEE